jgi:hypothetical protein
MPANIAAASTIVGRTSIGKSSFSGEIIVSNEPSSGKVIRVGTLMFSNMSGISDTEVVVIHRRGGASSAVSLALDGSGKITAGAGDGLSDISLPGDFTIEGWIYLTAGVPYLGVAKILEFSSGLRLSIQFRQFYEGYHTALFESGSSSVRGTNPVELNVWQHIAAIRRSGQVTVRVNGATESQTLSLSGTVTGTGGNTIGEGLTGYITDVRVTRSAVYSSGTFVPPTSPLGNTGSTDLLVDGSRSPNGNYIDKVAASTRGPWQPGGGVSQSVIVNPYSSSEARIANRITVPYSATLCVIGRDNPVYLEEGDTIISQSATGGRIEYACSYEEIS